MNFTRAPGHAETLTQLMKSRGYAVSLEVGYARWAGKSMMFFSQSMAPTLNLCKGKPPDTKSMWITLVAHQPPQLLHWFVGLIQ
jgi:hypothetical protein